MLRLALDSGLPLIYVRTDDVINAEEVLAFIAGEGVIPVNLPNVINKIGDLKMPTARVLYTSSECQSLAKLYRACVDLEKTIVFINTDKSVLQFDGGTLVPPKELVLKFITEMGVAEDPAALVPAFGGLTLKDIGEIAKMSMTRDGSLTARGIGETRRGYHTLKGITQVDTAQSYYVCPEDLAKWLKAAIGFFKFPKHPSLIPRGLLLNGPPGTGKTLASKHIAQEFGVPLFRFDLGAMMGKYVGDCHADGTEYLTDTGVKCFDDVLPTDRLATLNLKTGELEYQYPTARKEYYFEGEMVCFNGKQIKALVTPNHRMVVTSNATEVTNFQFAGELASKECSTQMRLPCAGVYNGGEDIGSITIEQIVGGNNRLSAGLSCSADTFIEFLGYFISEGHVQKDKSGYICLSQNPGAIADRMIAVCREVNDNKPVGVVNSRGNLQITFSNLSLGLWLTENCGRYSRNLKLPNWALFLSRRQASILMEALVAGDGNIDRKGADGQFSYATTSETLANQVERLVLHLGMTPSVRKHTYKDGIRYPLYTVYASPRTYNQVKPSKHISTTYYTGRVTCFTVPNSTLFTRYNRKWLVSGNSESALGAALAQIDSVEPAVVILDEVEKVFQTSVDSGVTSRMLSQLLWWLQEHKTKVFTVMTTNNKDTIPPELYREGRIDKVMTFLGIETFKAGYDFAKGAFDVMMNEMSTIPTADDYALLTKVIKGLFIDGAAVPQSKITQATYSLVRDIVSEVEES